MTDNVIDLSAKRDERRLIVACNCGCSTMRLFADGHIECPACDREITIAGSEWREQLPPAPAEAKPLDGFGLVPMQTPKRLFERWAKNPDVGEVCAAVAMYRNGSVSTCKFGEDFDTDERARWLANCFSDAFDALHSKP